MKTNLCYASLSLSLSLSHTHTHTLIPENRKSKFERRLGLPYLSCPSHLVIVASRICKEFQKIQIEERRIKNYGCAPPCIPDAGMWESISILIVTQHINCAKSFSYMVAPPQKKKKNLNPIP
jgi:hypothetical protein